jgi:hypothetical protein
MIMDENILEQNRGNTKISPLQGFVFIHGRLFYNNTIPSGFLKKNARWNER